jgi:hypothetical protein
MAKPALVSVDAPETAEPTLNLVTAKLPELKLPKLDLDALFATQKANLAAVYEAQNVLVDAIHAIVKVQDGYAGEVVAKAKASLATNELPKPDAVLADAKAAVERVTAVTKDVVGLGVAAQRRVGELLTARAQASITVLKAVAA